MNTPGAAPLVAQPELPEVKEQFRKKPEFAYEAQQRRELLLQKARGLIAENPARPTPSWELMGTTIRTPFYIVSLDVEKGGI